MNSAEFQESNCRIVFSRYEQQIASLGSDSGQPPVRMELIGDHGGFSGATIWRIVTGTGDYALRRWPGTRTLPRARILGLHRLLNHLRNEGLSFVAVPLVANGGTALPFEFGTDWQLEPWMPGNADFHLQPSKVRLSAAMEALAQWHLVASRFISRTEESQWFGSQPAAVSPTVAERLEIFSRADDERNRRIRQRMSSHGDPSLRNLAEQILTLFQRSRGRAIAELLSVRDVTVRQHPVLRDVWHDHLLFTGDKLTGLIDPAACRTDTVACDLSRLTGSLISDDAELRAFAFEEYQRHRPLSPAELTLTSVFDRSGVILSGWTWLEWLYLDRRQFSNVAFVADRLNQILERMRRLNDGASANQIVLP